jgi:hypothetical protein
MQSPVFTTLKFAPTIETALTCSGSRSLLGCRVQIDTLETRFIWTAGGHACSKPAGRACESLRLPSQPNAVCAGSAALCRAPVAFATACRYCSAVDCDKDIGDRR